MSFLQRLKQLFSFDPNAGLVPVSITTEDPYGVVWHEFFVVEPRVGEEIRLFERHVFKVVKVTHYPKAYAVVVVHV